MVRRNCSICHLSKGCPFLTDSNFFSILSNRNEKLFHELYKAHLEGRGSFDPSKGWYKGELGFFDFYIIPLAKKLKECGVFGVASDEFASYAINNRREWEAKGRGIVEDMIRECMEGSM